jgi:hypothetical protein
LVRKFPSFRFFGMSSLLFGLAGAGLRTVPGHSPYLFRFDELLRSQYPGVATT